MQSNTYIATAIFSVAHHAPIQGNPDFANLQIESNQTLPDERARGPGLYAIHFQGHLLYVGKFLGTRQSPYAGRVCLTRWAKHMGTLTLRDRRLSLSRRTIEQLRQTGIETSPIAALIDPRHVATLTHDRGRHSTFNRVLFAHEHLTQFLAADSAEALLDGFAITYTQAPRNSDLTIDQIRQAVSAAEKAAVKSLCPRCNAEISAERARDTGIETTRQEMEAQLHRHLYDPGAQDIGRRAVREPEPTPVTGREDEKVQDGEEEATDEEMFLETIDDFPAAAEAFQAVADAFADRPDAYLWYTAANGGDFRVRSTAARSRSFFNIAAVHWHPRYKRFKAEIYGDAPGYLDLGATNAQENYEGQSLRTRATFSVPEAKQALVDCLLMAADRYRDDQ